jgi:16S rRNA G527 N7-methylase RsmG
MIDRSLNYGRHLIRNFLNRNGNFRTVLDLGAGAGEDLEIARIINPSAKLHAIEYHPQKIELLGKKGITVHCINIDLNP